MGSLKISIHLVDGARWTANAGLRIRGAAFRSGRLVRGAELARLLQGAADVEAVAGLLRSFNGFFACVGTSGEWTIAAVDHIRSIPLFYGEAEGRLFISDSARWVRAQLDDRQRDPVAELEAEFLGYVTGPDTLYPRVKQLQAGELLAARVVDGKLSARTICYFRQRRWPMLERSEEELLAALDDATGIAMRNLIEYAAGRPIALALSGGIDSGRIAVWLKRLGYDNVIAYSYGRVGNQDAAGSRRLASRLGMRWEFAGYTEQLWAQWWSTPERREYYEHADGLCSLPILQEWPAVLELRERGLLPADTLIVPGYAAEAFVRPRQIPADWPLLRDDVLEPEAVARATARLHYSLWPWKDRYRELERLFSERVLAAMGDPASFASSAALYESWAIRERQAKFITNAVRTYEYWGYDWWLPLWDDGLLRFWSETPCRHRLGRRLSRRYFAELTAGLPHAPRGPGGRATARRLFHSTAALVRGVGERVPAVAALYLRLQRQLKYGTHPLAWYGIIPQQLFRQLYFGGANINSYLVLEWLGRLSFEAER